jgi:hypothetical protein
MPRNLDEHRFESFPPFLLWYLMGKTCLALLILFHSHGKALTLLSAFMIVAHISLATSRPSW